MKIVLMGLGCVFLLVAIVVVVGLLLPKHHTASRSASYRAKPEQLYALIAGPQTWRKDVRSYEAVADDGGRDLVRETTRDGEAITYELMKANPPASLKRRIATEDLPYAGTWTYALQPQGETTVVRITEDGEVYNPVFRFVSRFVLGQTRTIDNYLRALGKATGQQEIQIEN